MTTAALRQEMDALQETMTALAAESLETKRALTLLSRETTRLGGEVLNLKQSVDRIADEMLGFKREMADFKDEMHDFKREMADFKDEMHDFKREMADFKDETLRERKAFNKRLGDLSNRLGTLAEDIVAPNLPRIADQLLGCGPPELVGLRIARHWDGETREYDALVVCPNAVLVNETKSRLKADGIPDFLDKLAEFPAVFPAYADRRIVGILAGLSVAPGVVKAATRAGLAVMTMGDETMEVVNPEAIQAPDRAPD